jgi:hypothetical protein
LGERNARHPAARDEPLDIAVLDRPRRRDVLLLAACYDQSSSEGREERFAQLRKRLGVRNFKGWWPLSVGILVTLVVFLIIAVSGYWSWWLSVWPWLAIVAGWVPWAARGARWNLKAWRIARSTRALNQPVGPLARMLLALSPTHTAGQPLPAAARTDDRYELLGKLQGVLRALRMPGLVVLVDRVDEPYIVNGAPDLMKALIWPLLDNKFLKHAGLGVKMLLPIELERLIDREGHDFHQRARLDKQNMVRSLPWTGQALYDLAAARLRVCAGKGSTATLTDWFEPSVTGQRLTEAFATLRVPRNLFKFLYRLLTKHCNAQSDEKPAWKISSGTFESELALYQRDQEAFDRGTGAG